MPVFTQGEYNIPKGTQVWPNLHQLLHDERHWKDPHKFDPSRFLDADGKFTGIPPSFKPFGTGRRVCIGESLAKSELLVRLHGAAIFNNCPTDNFPPRNSKIELKYFQ